MLTKLCNTQQCNNNNQFYQREAAAMSYSIIEGQLAYLGAKEGLTHGPRNVMPTDGCKTNRRGRFCLDII